MPKKIKIGNITLGEKFRPVIIAEGCDNHFGDVKRAIEMVRLAKSSGADIIKFQHHLPDEEMLSNIPMSDNFKEPLYDFLVRNSLKLDDHKKIKNECEKIGINYLCTPFSFKAATEIFQLGVKAFKIGSGEMTDIPSLIRIAKFKLPMIISTGMSTFPEIYETYRTIIKLNKNLILMNCTSEYPPEYEDINLKVIGVMQKKFPNALIGHSDHTSDLVTSIGAVALGAVIIEKHVTIDKKLEGPDQDVSIDFNDLKVLVNEIKKLYLAMGDKKKINFKERPIRKWAFRSIVSVKLIKKGQIIKQSMIWSKRPGTGIPSKLMNRVIGKKAKMNIEANKLLKWSHLE